MQNANTSSPNYSDNKLTFKQDVIFRQENIPRERTYRIFPPVNKKGEIPQSHKFNIATLENKHGLRVSNLPLEERACLQKYNIKCNPKNYNIMVKATKYIFDAFTFDFEANHNQFRKTHYFSIAPNINPLSTSTKLPTLYRTSVCVNANNPRHYSFSTYAIVGGYSDGFYFMNRLDNNTNEYAHICKNTKQTNHTSRKVIAFPHMHQPSLKYEDRYKFELSTPVHMPFLDGKNMHGCLNYYLKFNNISPQMLLVNDDLLIDDIISSAQHFDSKHTLENTELGQLGKIAINNIGNYTTFAETNDYHSSLPTQACGTPYLRSK